MWFKHFFKKAENNSIEAIDTTVNTSNSSTSTEKIKSNIFKLGIILSAIGVGGFLLTAIIGLIGYGAIYFYDGYDFTKVCCTLEIIFMILGLISIVIGLIKEKKYHFAFISKKKKIFSLLLIGLSLAFSVILICNGVSASKSKSSSSSNSSSSYQMNHSTYCMLYMKVSNVKVTHKGNYTYVSGTITNNGTYQIKYVKVKASCKNASGTVIDTDWTYAVDSSWLNPGESKNFEMMIKDENNKIKTATVTVVYE